ncbi:MAG TPA: hypothetical protein VFS92_03395, partial [Planctomycetota bacterium]|nr:hypothetical protein [Planctomycetota bacterium]
MGKTTILREEGVVYEVDGRQRIPKGVSISCQKDVHIRGKGPSAVIEVEGTLELQGVSKREVILEGVTIEPCEKFQEVNIDSSIFRGGGGIRTPSGRASEGKLFVELCDFVSPARLDVTLSGGSIDLVSSTFHERVSIRAVDPSPETRNKVRLVVRGCQGPTAYSGFYGGLVVENVADVVVQLSRVAGPLTAIRDWDTP